MGDRNNIKTWHKPKVGGLYKNEAPCQMKIMHLPHTRADSPHLTFIYLILSPV
jgi:hypothetical protein